MSVVLAKQDIIASHPNEMQGCKAAEMQGYKAAKMQGYKAAKLR